MPFYFRQESFYLQASLPRHEPLLEQLPSASQVVAVRVRVVEVSGSIPPAPIYFVSIFSVCCVVQAVCVDDSRPHGPTCHLVREPRPLPGGSPSLSYFMSFFLLLFVCFLVLNRNNSISRNVKIWTCQIGQAQEQPFSGYVVVRCVIVFLSWFVVFF